jgi:hypothetical protein
MHTAAGLRFMRTLTRLGEVVPDYLESPRRDRKPAAHREAHQPAPSAKPAGASIRVV